MSGREEGPRVAARRRARERRRAIVRRRALAGLAVLAVAVLAVVALQGGGDDEGQDGRAGSTVAATGAGDAARARRAPSTSVRAIAARGDVPVLCYHQIRPLTGADGAAARPYIVPPARFAAQMRALDRAGYTTVTGDQLVDHMARGTALPRKPVLLTFDDASAGQYTRGLPVLEARHFKATFFVMTVVLGKQGWLTRGEVRRLDRAGMEIAPHTWDHHAVPGYAGDDWKVQLEQPKALLEGIVGHRLDLFAYPFGLWSPAAFPHLHQAGYRASFQLADKLDRRHPLDTIRRIIVPPDWSGATLLEQMRADF